MSDTKLFQPLKLGLFQLQHRVAMAPMTRFRADKTHTPLNCVQEYYAQRSHTPGTLIIAEAAGISETHVGYPHNPGIYHQAHIDAWKEVTDTVHAKGCYIFLQLNAVGRASDQGFPNVAPSATPLSREDSAIQIEDTGPPKAMSEEEILHCIRDFATAAKNALKADFDGVEIHGGNGYLIDQFLQESVNQRCDQWGESAGNRSRFAVETAKAVIDAVGRNHVGFRISPFSTYMGIRPKQPMEQFLDLTRRLKALDLAYLHVIESCVDNWYDVDRHESIEFILREWNDKTPVLVAGGYNGASAREAVDTKYAGFGVVVALGRGFLATPDIVARIKRGMEANEHDSETFYTPELRRGYYNDYGSIARDREERNLNSVDFPEFQFGEVEGKAGVDGSTGQRDNNAKQALWDIASYERECLDLAVGRLRPQLPEPVWRAWKVFIDVTDLYGQIYVMKHINSR